MITSKGNEKVKNVVDLQKHTKARVKQETYVVEGLKMFEELPRENILEVYATAEIVDKHAQALNGLAVEIVDERIFAYMADTKTPQGILCVARQMKYETADLLGKPQPFLLMLEDLQDPGNVGTIFRTAEGAGVDGIILSANCVDVYNPKAVRAAMGSMWRVPFLYTDDLLEVIEKMKKANITTYAAHLDGDGMYDQEDYQRGCAFLIGNEGNGLSDKLTKAAEKLIKIPMEGKVESLNAAIATAILVYEGARQRRS